MLYSAMKHGDLLPSCILARLGAANVQPFFDVALVFLDARPIRVHNEYNSSTCSLTQILQVAGFYSVKCIMLTYDLVLSTTTALITRPVNNGNIVSQIASYGQAKRSCTRGADMASQLL